jgi:hypothetical protein
VVVEQRRERAFAGGDASAVSADALEGLIDAGRRKVGVVSGSGHRIGAVLVRCTFVVRLGRALGRPLPARATRSLAAETEPSLGLIATTLH